MKLYWNYEEIEIGDYFISQFNTLKKKRLNNVPYEDLRPINISTLKHIITANKGIFQSDKHLYDIIPLFQDIME